MIQILRPNSTNRTKSSVQRQSRKANSFHSQRMEVSVNLSMDGKYRERTRVHGGSNAAISRTRAAGVEGGAELVLSRGARSPGSAARWRPEPGPGRPGHDRMGAQTHPVDVATT